MRITEFLPRSPLPGDLAAPLHILTPDEGIHWAWWILIGLMAALIILEQLINGPVEVDLEEPEKPVRKATPMPPHFVDEVKNRFDKEGYFRLGCHALADGLRGYLSARSGDDLSTSTASEVEEQIGSDPAVEALRFLSHLQFQRMEPTRRHFHQACDLVAEVSGRPTKSVSSSNETQDEEADADVDDAEKSAGTSAGEDE